MEQPVVAGNPKGGPAPCEVVLVPPHPPLAPNRVPFQTVTVEDITYRSYETEPYQQLKLIVGLIEKDLSEPYSIYTYRYFVDNWPHLCFNAYEGEKMVGTIVSKLDNHRGASRGYIAMLAVDKNYRGKKIGTNLVRHSINAMKESGCDEVVLETEVTNTGALALYQNLGFVKDKRLYKYYLNGVDAFRLKIFFFRNRKPTEPERPPEEQSV
eukprot:TRINITY_DN3036_c0_g2_i1.p1 TRINITY_DN3036_c0_g2~~TRINITY_DN3036_c0_g2_i1.p1  ORF type:complete len:211 (+),score=35.19 TRINITY_DN3036_c0_g2_i1:103-735(+)